ncbi:MAG: DUF4091 domain-containing protein [Victivallales bacterium]|nr:DUF4091 domain-containing protein [Victivallales bacterium]
MDKIRHLSLFFCLLTFIALAAPVENQLLFTIQDKAAEFQLPGVSNEVVTAPGLHGGNALKVTYPQFEGGNKWPAIYFRAPNVSPVSVEGWDGFVFTVYNPLAEQVDLGIAIRGDATREKHFGKHILLQPNAWNHFLLPVAEFAEITGGQIVSFDFFMTTPVKEFTLYYDDVKLVKRNPPDATVLPSVVTLADFEDSALPPQFECNGVTYELTDDWAQDGKQSILVKYSQFATGNPPWPAFQFYASDDPLVGFDWSAFSRFSFSANFTGHEVMPLKIFFADATGKRYTQECLLNPGQEATFAVNLNDSGLDLRHIQQIDFYLSRPDQNYEVYLDAFELTAAGTKELAEAEAMLDRLGVAISHVADNTIQDEMLTQYQQLKSELATARQTAMNDQNTMAELRQMANFSMRLEDWLYQNSRKLDMLLLCDATAQTFPKAPFGIAIADSMTKVMIQDIPLTDVRFAKEVAIEMARNEYESFQVVAIGRPEVQSATAEVVVSPLCQDDYELPADAASVSLVGHVKCERPPYMAEYQGWYPDPLLDFQQSAPVGANEAVAFWVRVKTPADAPAGEYHATVTIKGNGEVVAELPLTVTVYDFALPNGCPYDLATSFRDHIKQVWDPQMSPERYNALLSKIVDQLAEYKLSYDQIYRRVPKNPKNLNLPIEILKKQRDNGVLKSFCILNFDTPKDCTEIDDPRVQECIDDVLTSLDYWVPILKKEGLLEYGYLYGYDEYTPNYFPIIEKVCQGIKAKYPEVPISTTCYDASFATASCLKSIDIFTPLTPRFAPEMVAKSRAEGHKVWWYICIGPSHPYANWFIEYPAIEARLLMGAMTAKYRPEGFLYYALTRWPQNRAPIDGGPYTNWNPASYETANGDGSIFCAGPDGLLGTIRSENFRDGIEDYCYVLELEKRLAAQAETAEPAALAAARAALEVPAELVTTLSEFTHDPAALRAWRHRILQAIDNLK